MAKRWKLTAEDREILETVVDDLGAARTREVVLCWIGMAEFVSKEGDTLEAFRFLRDVLFDYHATGVLRAINEIEAGPRLVKASPGSGERTGRRCNTHHSSDTRWLHLAEKGAIGNAKRMVPSL